MRVTPFSGGQSSVRHGAAGNEQRHRGRHRYADRLQKHDDGQNGIAVLRERGIQGSHGGSIRAEGIGIYVCPVPILSPFVGRETIGQELKLGQHLFGTRRVQIQIDQTPAVG